jgi:kinesin family member 5
VFSGNKVGKSLLIDDRALPWIVKNANNEAAPIRRHIELALCHLAQHGQPPTFPSSSHSPHMYYIILIQFKLLSFAEVNAKDIISEGALWELVRISRECSREDIRTLAYRTLTSSPTLKAEMNRLGIKLL